MDSITIRISAAAEGGYMFDIWKRDAVGSDADIADNVSEDGGLCTTTMVNALGMAMEAAERIIIKEKGAECPGCGKGHIQADGAGCALSRYRHGPICAECGMRESLEGDYTFEANGKMRNE